MSTQPAPGGQAAILERTETLRQRPWITIVWDDPVNLMSYVAYVFRDYFKFSAKKAQQKMLQVHHEGKAIVSSGNRESMEVDVAAMHAYGLLATLEQTGE